MIYFPEIDFYYGKVKLNILDNSFMLVSQNATLTSLLYTAITVKIGITVWNKNIIVNPDINGKFL